MHRFVGNPKIKTFKISFKFPYLFVQHKVNNAILCRKTYHLSNSEVKHPEQIIICCAEL